MSFYVTGGTLQSDAPSYVEREADRRLYEGLLGGEFCYVLTARQMGKSSLMVRTATRLQAAGIHVAVLDLTALGGQNITPEQWYFGLLDTMGQELGLQTELERFWEAHRDLGPLHRFIQSIRQIVLSQLGKDGGEPDLSPTADRPDASSSDPAARLADEGREIIHTKLRLVVFVDEIDFVRSLPFSTDEFFAAIRECYNHRTIDSTYEMLTFCLLGVASPSDLIRDTRTTPFNIGQRIELNDFSMEEAAPLAQGLEEPNLGRSDSKLLLDRILYWTEGHPYLTQRLCRATADSLRARRGDTMFKSDSHASLVDHLCTELFFSTRARERDDNLIFVRERLLRNDADLASLLDLYLRVWQDRRVMDDEFDPLISLLNLSGVVRVTNGRLRERNRIYGRVFDDEWVRSNLPGAELRRQRQAYRRGVAWATTVSSLVVLVMAVLVIMVLRQVSKQRSALAQVRFSQARTARLSGSAGQRISSLSALKLAGANYQNRMELRNEALASLALMDLQKEKSTYEPASGADPTTTSAALGPSLTSLATGDDQGVVKLRDLRDNRIARQFGAAGIPVAWIRLSPDGRFIATKYEGAASDVPVPRQLIIWEAGSGRTILTLTNDVLPGALDFSPDSSKVAVGFPEGLITIRGLPGAAPPKSIQLRGPVQEKEKGHGIRRPACIRFDPSGTRLAESSGDSLSVQIWDIETQSSIRLPHRSPAVRIAWHPDGQHLATATENRDIFLWDLQSLRYQEFPQAHSGEVIDLLFNPGGDLLVSMGAEMAMKLWIPATGRSMTHSVGRDFSGPLCFNEDGSRLGHASVKGAVESWRVMGGKEYRIFRVPGEVKQDATSLCFSPEGQVLAVANDVGASVWDTATGNELALLTLPITQSVFFHPIRGDLTASTPEGLYRWPRHVSENAASRLFEFGPSECFDLPSRLGAATACAAGTDAAVIHEDHIHSFRTDERSATKRLSVKGSFQAVMLSPDGKWLATWTESDNQIQVRAMNPFSVEPVQRITGSRHFSFSPDSRYLVTSWAGSYYVKETGTWMDQGERIQRSTSGDPDGPLAFARSGKDGMTLLAAADSTASLELFEIPNGDFAQRRVIARLESPDSKPPRILLFNADGSRLAVAGADQTVAVWDLLKLRDGLAKRRLDDGFPKYQQRTEGRVAVAFKPDKRDTESPRLWQSVETVTGELENASGQTPLPKPELLLKRGKSWLFLNRLKEAEADFNEALRLGQQKAGIQEFIQKAYDESGGTTENSPLSIDTAPAGAAQGTREPNVRKRDLNNLTEH